MHDINKKKIIRYIAVIFVIISLAMLFNIGAYASEIVDKSFVDVQVQAAVVIDAESGRVLFEKDSDKKLPMASLTKVMTSIMLVENCDMDELIEVPKEATVIGGSEAGLKAGDKVSARSLLYGMLLPSRK